MLLNDNINQSISNYPTLFRAKGNPQLSRLLVLEYMFCVIGNGCQWHPSGYLAHEELIGRKRKPLSEYGLKKYKKLPKNYYDKNLYKIEIVKDKWKEAKTYLKSMNFWFHAHDNSFIIECNEDTALNISDSFSENQFLERAQGILNRDLRREFLKKAETELNDIHPSPLSKYSALVEMVNGRTDSLGSHEDFMLDKDIIKSDYIEGAKEIAGELIRYYSDESRYNQIKERRVEIWGNNWATFTRNQIEWCQKLLSKYS